MKKIYLLVLLFSFHLAFAQSLEPLKIVKEKGDEQLVNGEIPGEIFYNYSVDGEIIFKAVESLTQCVDALIFEAIEHDRMLVHLDSEVIYFCEKTLVLKNLILN
ncbi:MAG: hypothetical protein H6731_07850 [Myxococcales bacterium]|nr:MAG: hypothetical protein H6731_07850 [Myxococcales bacterium]